MIPGKQAAKATSIYRELPVAKRVALVTALMSARKEARALFIQRMVARGGGFRSVTLQQWPLPKLAAEVVRMNAQSADDELDLLHALYVEVEPAIQTAFLKAAGVKADGAVIDESLQAPFADVAAVQRAADAILKEFGDDAKHYLRTIAQYNAAAWPGVEHIVAQLQGAAA